MERWNEGLRVCIRKYDDDFAFMGRAWRHGFLSYLQYLEIMIRWTRRIGFSDSHNLIIISS